MENMKYYNLLRAVPPEALKTIGAGRLKGMSDINPMWRIKVLTETFGVCGFGWRYEIVKQWTENGTDDEIRAFCNINLYVKIGDQWSEAIPGTGGSSLATVERNGVYVSDEGYKMALTDALSVACKALGVGADVYYAKDRSKYTAVVEQSQNKAKPQKYVCCECGKPFTEWNRPNGEHWSVKQVYELACSRSDDGKARCTKCNTAQKELPAEVSNVPNLNAEPDANAALGVTSEEVQENG